MTPKEKAQEILTMLIEDGFDKSAVKWVAKITVNEILKAVEGKHDEYWQEVKQEIEKL